MDEKIKALATKEELKTLATKAELKAEPDKIGKLQTYDLSLFNRSNSVKFTLSLKDHNFT